MINIILLPIILLNMNYRMCIRGAAEKFIQSPDGR